MKLSELKPYAELVCGRIQNARFRCTYIGDNILLVRGLDPHGSTEESELSHALSGHAHDYCRVAFEGAAYNLFHLVKTTDLSDMGLEEAAGPEKKPRPVFVPGDYYYASDGYLESFTKCGPDGILKFPKGQSVRFDAEWYRIPLGLVPVEHREPQDVLFRDALGKTLITGDGSRLTVCVPGRYAGMLPASIPEAYRLQLYEAADGTIWEDSVRAGDKILGSGYKLFNGRKCDED